MNQYLQRIDLEINQTNVFGKPWPGNPPQLRKRQANATLSDRRAVPCLPINFYDENWLATLENQDRKAVKAKPTFTLPIINIDDGCPAVSN